MEEDTWHPPLASAPMNRCVHTIRNILTQTDIQTNTLRNLHVLEVRVKVTIKCYALPSASPLLVPYFCSSIHKNSFTTTQVPAFTETFLT